MNTSNQTTNKEEIKSWASARNGVPAMIKETENQQGEGLLRIHFPQASKNNDEFNEISWDKFFEKFDDDHLAMVYQDKKEDGEQSTFHKFIDRN